MMRRGPSVALAAVALAWAWAGLPGCAETINTRPPTVDEVLDRTCGMGDGEACAIVADAFDRGKGRSHDRERASITYMRACYFKSARSCRMIAQLYLAHRETPRDPAEPAELLTKACDSADATGCRLLAQAALEHAPGAPEEAHAMGLLERAVSLLRSSCAHGIVDACDELGRMYSVGEGLAQDTNQGERMQRVACDGGVAEACLRLGNAEKGIAALSSQCDEGDAGSCGRLAAVYREPSTGDATRAAALSRRACEAGFPEECALAAEALGNADLYGRAAEIWQKECLQGYGASCLLVAKLLESGKTGAADAAVRAAALYQSLCQQGHTWSCEHLKSPAPASAPARSE